MLSIPSLSQELLPNVYIKRLSLETTYATKITPPKNDGYTVPQYALEKQMVPAGSLVANLTLAIKFSRGDGDYKSDLIKLLESEYMQNYNIYIHQLGKKSQFDYLDSTNPVIYDSQGQLSNLAKGVLINESPFAESVGTQTKVINFKNLYYGSLYPGSNPDGGSIYIEQGSSALGQDDTFENLPVQILSDGTRLVEIVANIKFENITKNQDFLGYAIVSSVSNPDLDDNIYVSAVTRDIAILDGKFQDKGLIFTIAQYPANEPNVDKLLKYGNPGDIWAGPVHYHQPTDSFMAGAAHVSSKPHPKLDYAIVRNTRFVDNRVFDKIQKVLYNASKDFSFLDGGQSPFYGAFDPSNWLDYKKVAYISDISLTQDRLGNVEGYFAIDKEEIIADKCFFRTFFASVAQLQGQEAYYGDLNTQQILNSAKLLRCAIKNGNEVLAVMDDDNSSTPQIFEYGPNSSYTSSQTKSFTVEKINMFSPGLYENEQVFGDFGTLVPRNPFDTREVFVFKHKIGNQNRTGPITTTQNYSLEVEYSDPTIDFVKMMRNGVTTALTDVKKVIKFVEFHAAPLINNLIGGNLKSGFDPITGQIHPSVITMMVDSGFTEFTDIPLAGAQQINLNADIGILLLTSLMPDNLMYSYIYAFLYSNKLKDKLSAIDFAKYFINLGNIYTITNEKLIQLESLLRYIQYTLNLALEPVGAKALKVSRGSGYIDSISQGNVKKTSKEKTIKTESSKQSTITTSDHGYDFTGIIDSDAFQQGKASNTSFGNFFFNGSSYPEAAGRNKEAFLDIFLADYELASLYNYFELTKNSSTPENFTFSIKGTTKDFNALDMLYSYLHTPCLDSLLKRALISTVVLPQSVFVGKKNVSPQIIFTSIAKIKRDILENNRIFINQAPNQFGGNAVAISLAEDLITLHARQGTTFPEITQGEFFKIQNQQEALSPNDNDIGEAEGENLDNFIPGYKFNYNFKQVEIKRNNLMNSLFSKQALNKFTNNFRLNYNKQIENLEITDQQKVNIELGKESLESLSLVVKDGTASQFKDYLNSDQGYIVNGIIDPSRISQFFFVHQNIVRVEYLSGYEFMNYDIIYNPEDSPYTKAVITVYKSNIKKPIWRTLNKEVIDTFRQSSNAESKLLCRLVRYDSPYINKFFAKNFDMPLVHSYFTLNNGGPQVIV